MSTAAQAKQRAETAATAYHAVMDTPFGHVGLRTRDERIVRIDYLHGKVRAVVAANALAREACAQIRAYVANPQFRFELPYALEGTPFQRSVWRQIEDIACGTTRTYGELAAALGTAPRAVGGACGSNPGPLLVACHRVVARSGALGGFMHSRALGPLSIKQWLLRHEGAR
jgi:methylated-DNA-[protein]-cysteine S-methyltransferase